MDPYAILGVSPHATAEEIDAAYRRAAQLYHPDKHGAATSEVREEAERRMKVLNEARRLAKEGLKDRSQASRTPGGQPSGDTLQIECPNCGAVNAIPLRLLNVALCQSCERPIASRHEPRAQSERTTSAGSASGTRTQGPSGSTGATSSAPTSRPAAPHPRSNKASPTMPTWAGAAAILVILLIAVAAGQADKPPSRSSSLAADSDGSGSDSGTSASYSSSDDNELDCLPPAYLSRKNEPVEVLEPRHDVEVRHRLILYRFSGCSLNELQQEMRFAGPQRYDTYLEWGIDYDYNYAYYPVCRIVRPTVDVEIETLAPQYVDAVGFSPDYLNRRWKRYISALAEWNSGLRAIYMEAGVALVNALKEAPRYYSCNRVDGAARSIYRDVLDTYEAKADEYEDSVPLNASFPY